VANDVPEISARRVRALRALCIGVVAVAGLEFVIATTAMTLRRPPDSTDFATYYMAAAQARDGLSPYDAAAIAARGRVLGFEHDQFPFLYPPPFAIAMQPLVQLPYAKARQVWVIVVTLALLAALLVNTIVLGLQASQLGLQNTLRFWIVLAAFVPAALNSTGVHNDIRAGSVAALLYLALILVVWGVVTRRVVWTALGLAAAVVLKLTPVVAVVWAAWRGARGAALAGLALLGLGGAAAAWQLGWDIGPEYVRVALLPALESEAPRPMNQSLDAMLSRLLVPSEIVRAPFDLPMLKHALSLALSGVLAFFTVTCVRARHRHAALLPVELGFVMLAVLMIMKLTWLHTLAAILFVWPCVMLPILRAAERGAPWALRTGIAASVGFFLSSAHIPVLWSALRHGPAVVLISVHLVGLLILWWVCRGVLQRESEIVS
jgi:hypothetical protein